MTKLRTKRVNGIYEWIGRHIGAVVAVVVIAAIGLGFLGPVVGDDTEPNFDPDGEIFTLLETADTRLEGESTLSSDGFIVEAADGVDVLTADAFREWQAASDRVRDDAVNQTHLATEFDEDLMTDIPGVLSIVDIVAGELPDGLESATDADIKGVVGTLIEDDPGVLDQLSAQSALTNAGWTSPAFLTSVIYNGFDDSSDAELWLRDVQSQFQQDAVFTDSMGIGIDFDTTFDEAIEASAPFIFLAVALIVLLIAVVHRSYWSAMLVAAGLGLTLLTYTGIASLLGLKMGSLMLTFIVPIAMISFGVDFYIHGIGRVREMQIEHDMNGTSAYPAGMRAVFTAMLLAALTSMAAFLSNASSGTEAITQFGIGAAISLGCAYLILGQLTPRVLVGVEGWVGPTPVKGVSKYVYRAGMLISAIVGGLAVALGAVMPSIGVFAIAGLIVLFLIIPAFATRRRNRKAAAQGRTLSNAIVGSAHGLEAAGTLVHGLAKRRAITLPAVGLLFAVGLVGALNVQSGFELTDFLPSSSGVVQSLDTYGEHYPEAGEGSSMIYIEGDLAQPESLEALETAMARLDATTTQVGRNQAGELVTRPNAADLVRQAMTDPAAVGRIEAAGVAMTDIDANGLPDEAAQIQAVFDDVVANGLFNANGDELIAAEEVGYFLSNDGVGDHATRLTVQIVSFTDGDIIRPVKAELEATAAELEAAAPGLTLVGVTGNVIAEFESLESFRNSMLVSLPIAIIITLLLAAAVLRSFRFAAASVVPIAFVVVGVYAFMTVFGYKINVVTATIAAIAVGVGIDFSTHFTVRYIEELKSSNNRLEALRIAGSGTGGALVLSAVSSVVGFTIMAFAPTPIFAVYGALTAVMIALALFTCLVVLPSILYVVTPRPTTIAPARSELLEDDPQPAYSR